MLGLACYASGLRFLIRFSAPPPLPRSDCFSWFNVEASSSGAWVQPPGHARVVDNDGCCAWYNASSGRSPFFLRGEGEFRVNLQLVFRLSPSSQNSLIQWFLTARFIQPTQVRSRHVARQFGRSRRVILVGENSSGRG